MKILITGGVKSGKSLFAESRCLGLAKEEKPIYLATTEMVDSEMRQRIEVHQKRRQEQFTTVEESLVLHQTIQKLDNPVLIECMTMWINNMLYHQKSEQTLFDEVEKVLGLPNDMVFVINEVGMGIIPDNALARTFVDLSGKVSQTLGNACDEGYFCVAGQPLKVK